MGQEQLRTEKDVAEHDVPLCVDLDGTLIKTDVLVESIVGLISVNVLYVFLLPLWLIKGKAHFKTEIARRVALDVAVLPYQEDFCEYLKLQRSKGRKLVLATASHVKFAQQIAEQVGIFDEVVGTDGRRNLSGKMKMRQLREMYGEGGFDYAGNAKVDLKIWPHARKAILVNPEYGVKAAAGRVADVDRVFEGEAGGVNVLLRALRLHQWLKNLLLFVPIVVSQQFGDIGLVGKSLVGFLAFGFCASGVYLLNDLMDLTSDRHHPRKRMRPLASGDMSTKEGMVLTPMLFLAGFGFGAMLPQWFSWVLGGYCLFSLAYSFRLKRTVMVDVLVLAGLYTIRIIAGAAAIGVTPSFWLLAFSMFVFLSLAMLKRYAELFDQLASDKKNVNGRGYRIEDLAMISSLGAASGYVAVLVLALYIHSEEVKLLYNQPEVIWLLCPLLLYWISRMWIAAGRGRMHDDPLIYALKDSSSRWTGIAGGAILVLAMEMF